MDILIAVRSEGKKKVLNSLGECVVLDTLFESIDNIIASSEVIVVIGIFHLLKLNNPKLDYLMNTLNEWWFRIEKEI